MSPVTRRGALSLIPAVGAAVAAPAALAVLAAVEAPEKRARRLVHELKDVLNVAWEGRFGAEVFPSNAIPHDYPSGFFDIRSQAEAWRIRTNALRHVEAIRNLDPMDRARHHAQELTLAMRQIGNPAEFMSQWYGDDCFVVVRRMRT